MTQPPSTCWVDPRVVVGQSQIEGQGLFATSLIRRGEVVGTLGGRLVDDAELRRIAQRAVRYNSVAIDDGINLMLEGDEVLGRGNHSCDPNVWLRDAFTLEARRDIAPAEELTQDYAVFTAVEWEMICACRSGSCRGVVRGTDWQRPELQQRYRGHFSPFLNRRIDEGKQVEHP